jgi:CRISPR-associated protein (TIGR02584 family)
MRDVLVALCGFTPQVVTETLWALAHRALPTYPAEVWILTTESGRRKCREALLAPSGAVARYVREYRPRPEPRCGPAQIIVLKGANGKPLDDVRSEQDHRAIADQVAEFLRRQTERADTRLHCSVAGGRKTMGVLLAAALQLYGRPDDRLYHVLVPPEFESLDDFFYPPKHPRRLTLKDGRRLSTEQAMIDLAEIPYMRLRGLLSSQQLSAMSGLSEAVEIAQRRLRSLVDPEKVRIDTARDSLQIGDQTIRLSPAHLTIYRALARTKLRHCERREQLECGDCMDCFLPFTKDTWERTKVVLEERGGRDLLPKVKKGTRDDDEDALRQFRALIRKTNTTLENALHLTGAQNPYRIRSGGPRNETVYGLAIDKAKLVKG